MAQSNTFVLPAPLESLSAYVAALASPVRRDLLDKGIAVLCERGWHIEIDKDIDARDWLTAGSVGQRCAAITRWQQTDIGLLMIARGGYGTVQLLPHLQAKDWRRQTRWLLGASDSTALQMWMMQEAGLGSLYGPMPSAGMARSPAPQTLLRLEDILLGRADAQFAVPDTGHLLQAGRAEGRAVGGCLSLLAALVGTGCLPDSRGSILFLEDIGEAPHRLERMLQQLLHSGWLTGITAVVLGTFPGCEPREGAGYTLEELLGRFFAPFGIPVWWGYPFGHVRDGDPCDTLILGAQYELLETGLYLIV